MNDKRREHDVGSWEGKGEECIGEREKERIRGRGGEKLVIGS